MHQFASNTTQPKAYRASMGVSLADSAVLAVLYYQSDQTIVKAMGAVERPYVFDYFGLELPMDDNTTVDGLVEDIKSMHAVRAEAYASATVPDKHSVQELSGQAGDSVGCAAASAVQRAQMWGNDIFKRGPDEFAKTRYVFRFNAVTIPFNPWAPNAGPQLAEDAMTAQNEEAAAYRCSAAYQDTVKKDRAQQENLQAKEAQLMAELPNKLKGPLPELMRWVTDYATCHDRGGVSTDSRAVVFAFNDHGYAEGAYVGPQYQELLATDKDKFGRYIIGQFLNILPMDRGMPGILWVFADRYHAMAEA
jgi:hypothetical protein